MILLLSEEYELSTEEVIDWILHYKKHFIRINQEDKPFQFTIHKEETSDWKVALTNGSQSIGFDAIESYWYRRGLLKTDFKFVETKDIKFNFRINLQIDSEVNSLQEFIHHRLKNKNAIGSYLENRINKLNVIHLAQNFGLMTPETLITSNRASVNDFCSKHGGRIITKAISNGFQITVGDITFYTHTILLTQSKIKFLEKSFCPTLFQECLDKKFELRIFYLDEVCYAAAIYSQNDPQTKIDFRNYNREKANRTCPFVLPQEIQSKIINLMKELQMRSGSIDMVVDTKNNYYFLEVNPVGQFKQVSAPCNYHLENVIAKKLVKTVI